MSREAAGKLVVDKLVDKDDPTIVFSHAEPVDSSNTLLVGRPLRLGDREAVAIESSAWFFWIDDEPGARFDHPTRFVLVDRNTGELTVHDAKWWPVLDDAPLWVETADYWDESNWVNASEVDRRGTLTLPDFVGADACQPGFGTAIVINGHEAGESGAEDFAFDANNMSTTLEGLGFDVTRAGENTDEPVGHVGTWLENKAKELKAGDRLVIYITGHGSLVSEASRPTLGRGEAGGIYSGLLAQNLAKFDPGVEIIVIVDACHSESLLPDLNCSADLAISAAREDQSSYSDIDEGPFWSDDDPDPEDGGGEFTSALARSIREIVGDPTQRQHIEDVAGQAGGSFMGALLTEAGLRARMYDFAYIRGLSEPQFRAGSGKTTPTVPDPTPPVCDGDPGDTTGETGYETSLESGYSESGYESSSGGWTCADAELEAIAITLGEIIGTDVADAVCNGAQSLPADNPTEHSNGQQTSTATEEVDWIDEGVILGVDLPGDVPCGPGATYNVFCTGQTLAIDGPVAIVWGRVAAPIDPDEKTFSYQYGFVFDTDGDDANNYVPSPSYPSDFFAGTDQWFYTVHNAGEGWYTWASSAAAGFANVPSSERIIVAGDLVALVVNEDEVHPDTASYRITAFRHLGDYGQSMPWSGDVVPAVADGLAPL
ncbi:MAG TPA: caspase family protein [Nannocystaceae bacterium]|nr:caspase family protein [Nannocystaceae bacterium]